MGSVAALFLQQAALHVGPLRASQPFLVIIDPIVSIALSVWLFGEHFSGNAAALALAAAAFAVMCAAIVLLTQTAPATMNADVPDGRQGRRQRIRVRGARGSQRVLAYPAGKVLRQGRTAAWTTALDARVIPDPGAVQLVPVVHVITWV